MLDRIADVPDQGSKVEPESRRPGSAPERGRDGMQDLLPQHAGRPSYAAPLRACAVAVTG
ncbi:hypothetical protein [Sorangium cellulosum]|uniref:hypothetical protein n=1 Tax=Sorangium cellulosum TaxID=56 RepID=UPI0002F74B48|nr:hypothetical protein [Sorangium cellulosum]